ncbi:hypothetical protein IVA87_13910 [Bradyrhizobium sp. 147]|uniref:hypothetical protein n=1 Tax=Bradyrhizobium sp. 147 TaxID=2782623 RepID=UPI001FF8FFA2|nr:hypothetical protein [Bradyrhizobium sp. 147]MCK1680497.1 hypothetical protein [Bradyrhizobium sp. 147]
MNFQVTVLKILVSYPDGFAVMADLKFSMAILATNGPDWIGAQHADFKRMADQIVVLTTKLVSLQDRTVALTVPRLCRARHSVLRPADSVEKSSCCDAEISVIQSV